MTTGASAPSKKPEKFKPGVKDPAKTKPGEKPAPKGNPNTNKPSAPGKKSGKQMPKPVKGAPKKSKK